MLADIFHINAAGDINNTEKFIAHNNNANNNNNNNSNIHV